MRMRMITTPQTPPCKDPISPNLRNHLEKPRFFTHPRFWYHPENTFPRQRRHRLMYNSHLQWGRHQRNTPKDWNGRFGWKPKNRSTYPKMGWWKSWKTLWPNGWFGGVAVFLETLISQLIEENPKQATKIHVLFFGCPKKSWEINYHLVAGISQDFFWNPRFWFLRWFFRGTKWLGNLPSGMGMLQ